MISAAQSNHPLAPVSAPGDPVTCLEEAQSRIRAAGMRVTRPRVALVEALLRQPGPVSIEQLHQLVGLAACDLVTIYRCLAAFEDLGLVRRTYLHNGTCLYEQTIDASRRYHIVCRTCGHTDPVDFSLAPGVEQKLHERGYARVSHVVEFFGLCPACQRTDAATRGGGRNLVLEP